MFCTPEVEEREEAEGNPNSVVYAVAVKTDVEIIVVTYCGRFSSLFSVSALERYNCVRGHRLQANVSRSAKRGLKTFVRCSSWEKLRIETKITQLWSNNSACTSQRLFSNLALFVRISHFAMNIIMAQALPNRQSKFRQIQKFQQSAKINSRQNFRPYGITCMHALCLAVLAARLVEQGHRLCRSRLRRRQSGERRS